MHLIATCPEETKPVLALELEALGAQNIVPGYRNTLVDVEELAVPVPAI